MRRLPGGRAALTTMTAAQTAVAEPLPSTPPQSYRDLLDPVPNALAALKADDARLAQEKQPNEKLAQYFYHHHHHHHHHHHRYYYGVAPRGYYYHHHHLHHHGFGIYIR